MIWASATEHVRGIMPMPPRRRNRRHCPYCPGNERNAGHYGTANGVVLAWGCEWHMRLFVRGGPAALRLARARVASGERSGE